MGKINRLLLLPIVVLWIADCCFHHLLTLSTGSTVGIHITRVEENGDRVVCRITLNFCDFTQFDDSNVSIGS